MGRLFDLRTLDLTAATGTVAATTPAAGATAIAEIDVSDYDVLAVSTLEQSGTWGAAVITLQLDDVAENRAHPNDDMKDYLRTIIDVGQLQNVDVSAHSVARLQLTTNQVGACTASLLVVGSNESESVFHRVLNANDITDRVGFGVAAFSELHVEVNDRASWGGALDWSTAVIEWKTSIDGNIWYSYPTAVETVSAGRITLDVKDANYVAGHVTTAEGDLLVLDITAFGVIPFDHEVRDPLAGAQVVISTPHHEVHEQCAFICDVVDTSMGLNDTLILAWKTMSAPKYMHFIMRFASKAAAHIELLEGPTWDNQSGAQIPIFNRARFGIKTSVVLEDQSSGGFTATENMNANPTTLAGGTVVHDFYDWSDHKTTAKDRDSDEIILKADTQYAVVLTADAAVNAGQLLLTWYEHNGTL